MIDLHAMCGVFVDAQRREAIVGGGCTWRDVDATLKLYGLCTPGRVVHSTGVGGLALGGGWGYLTRQHGLTCDNVFEVELVTADSRVIRCDSAHNSELFWALRGAGAGGLGTATSFRLKLYEAPKVVYHGILAWPVDLYPGILDAVNASRASWHTTFVAFPLCVYPDPNNANFLALALLVYCEGAKLLQTQF